MSLAVAVLGAVRDPNNGGQTPHALRTDPATNPHTNPGNGPYSRCAGVQIPGTLFSALLFLQVLEELAVSEVAAGTRSGLPAKKNLAYRFKMTPNNPSYLIIGAGVFGVSTAYHLIRKYPNASVTLVDRDAFDAESRVAASWDWNKVIRADYDDKVYCRLALEAQEIFKSDPLWKPYFHQTGVYWTCRSDYAQNVINNHKELGRNDDIIALPVAEARKLYGGVFDSADYTGVREVLINRASGWAAAGDALRAVTKRCLELGVKYLTADVAALEFDGRGSCTGVSTRSGQILSATHVIVAAGAFTPTLLEWSAASSGNPGLRAGERILAAGITTGMAHLKEDQYKKFKDMPVGFQGYTPEEGTAFLIYYMKPANGQ